MTYEINKLPSFIPIGNQRDFGHVVTFDLTAWADLGADDWKVTYIRPGESEVRPVAEGDIAVENNVLTWTISEAVTGISGTGSVVIEAYLGNVFLKHSDATNTIVGAGHGDVGDAPEPLANWLEDATETLAAIQGISFALNDGNLEVTI